ncbi:MAG: AraC family transcriptional regulator [Paenibacillus sp.]|jgi:two-component system response regulator YesN|nr:AraC family transcriptional regulator [Paenibacillus sp.]
MKVFLVDDEKGIVEGLQKLIGRFIPECEIVGVAYNGLDGARLIEENKPDIVITDIRMPHADGLEMIAMLKDSGCQSKFILLSGYADFEYARKGMRLGVQLYINKPVEEEELRNCVCKVMEEIRKERVKLEEVNNFKRGYLESTLRDIFDAGSENPNYVDELLRMAGIPLEQTQFVCALLELESNLSNIMESGINLVFEQVERAFGQYRGVYRFRYSVSQIAVMVTKVGVIKNDELIYAIQRLKEAVSQELRLSLSIGVGAVKEQPVDISLSFEEARRALSYKLIQGVGAVISFPEIMKLMGGRHNVPEELIDGLEASLDNMDEEQCVRRIHEIFHWMEGERGISLADLQLHCLNILLSSMRKMSFQQLQQNDLLGRNILSLEGISRFTALERLEEWMTQTIRDIISFKLEHNISKKKDVITEIKKYITEHYNESISLAELSARFFINPSYLSQLFKQKTGDTYLNFLAQVRINKAKEFLEKTDLKVYEICKNVGYSDTQHFARLFEKQTGYKPGEYRRKNSSE